MFGTNPQWASLVQAFLSALVPVLTARLSAQLFPDVWPGFAGFIAAVHYELVLWTSGQLLTEPLYTVLMAASLWALGAALGRDPQRPSAFALTGALFGLAALVRPLALAVALTLAGAGAIVAIAQRRRRDALMALVLPAACLATVLPWATRNHFALGTFTLASTEAGHVFWLGNNPGYDRRESADFVKWAGYTPMFPPLPDAIGKPEADVDRIFRAAALQHIVAHPGLWLKRAGDKLWNMWRPTLSGSSRRHTIVAWTFYVPLLALSVAGLALSWPARTRAWPLWVFLATHLALHGAITGAIRFRVPL